MQKMFPFLLLLIQNVDSSNILYVSSMPFRSYHTWNQKLAFGLVENGHNVTLLRTYQGDLLRKENYTEILIEGVYETIQNNTKSLFSGNVYSSARFILDIQNYCLLICQSSAKSKQLSHFIASYKSFKFDLVIFELTAGVCFYPLIKKFDYPAAIGVTQFLLPSYVAYSFGNQLNPAYIPWQRIPYGNEMTFFERVWNYILIYVEIGNRYTNQYKQEHEIAQTIFGNDIPSMEALERHISLVFTNTEPLLNYVQPLAPNIIPVAGLHLTEPKRLPQDLQSILDGAKHGAIIFSLGTILQSRELSQEIQKSLLDAFSLIPETVLWKFESEIENVPKNVIVRKWLPQSDILGHPNVKLLIGHGGALSTQEALYHGVPILCIPFYADQHHAAKVIVKRKFGVSLSVHTIESKLVWQKLEEVLRNPMYYGDIYLGLVPLFFTRRYSNNMKKASKMFRKRKETPMKRAIFWIEYLLEYGDVDFLSTSARDLPFYKSSSLDVLVFLLSVTLILYVLFYKLIQFILIQLRPKEKVKLN